MITHDARLNLELSRRKLIAAAGIGGAAIVTPPIRGQQRHGSGLAVEHLALPPSRDTFHRVVVLNYCKAVQQDNEWLRSNGPA
jgi:hypothetical protein